MAVPLCREERLVLCGFDEEEKDFAANLKTFWEGEALFSFVKFQWIKNEMKKQNCELMIDEYSGKIAKFNCT